MMSFPIDYRFYGKSKGIKHTLVGNAVPPKLSYAIAKAIALNEDMDEPENYIRINHDETIPFHNLNGIDITPKQETEKRIATKFKYHIPYMIIDSFRVELTNYSSDFKSSEFSWKAEIHYSQGKARAKKLEPKN